MDCATKQSEFDLYQGQLLFIELRCCEDVLKGFQSDIVLSSKTDSRVHLKFSTCDLERTIPRELEAAESIGRREVTSSLKASFSIFKFQSSFLQDHQPNLFPERYKRNYRASGTFLSPVASSLSPSLNERTSSGSLPHCTD